MLSSLSPRYRNEDESMIIQDRDRMELSPHSIVYRGNQSTYADTPDRTTKNVVMDQPQYYADNDKNNGNYWNHPSWQFPFLRHISISFKHALEGLYGWL